VVTLAGFAQDKRAIGFHCVIMTGFDGNLIFDALNIPYASERSASPFSKPRTSVGFSSH
jgi:hypothetical protein